MAYHGMGCTNCIGAIRMVTVVSIDSAQGRVDCLLLNGDTEVSPVGLQRMFISQIFRWVWCSLKSRHTRTGSYL